MAEPHARYGYTRNQRYYALNILEELDAPGEWFLDRASGVLYFWPPGPITEQNTLVSVLSEPLLALDDAEFVIIQDLNLEFSRGVGVWIKGGAHNLVAGCTLRNLGGNAASLEGGRHNGITGCEICDLAGAGINLGGGDRKTLTRADNFATGNHIHHYSRWIRTYNGAIRIQGVGNRVANNCIHDAPHAGIELFGNEHTIEFNELYALAQQTSDVGAFYMGRDWTQRGNVLRYNYFHDLLGPEGGELFGIYLDDFTSGQTIYGNVFYNVRGSAVRIAGGRDNTVENNLFVKCLPAVEQYAAGLTWATNYFDKTRTDHNPTLYQRMEQMNYRRPPYSTKYPELLSLYDDEPAAPKHNKVNHNVSWGGRWLDM